MNEVINFGKSFSRSKVAKRYGSYSEIKPKNCAREWGFFIKQMQWGCGVSSGVVTKKWKGLFPQKKGN